MEDVILSTWRTQEDKEPYYNMSCRCLKRFWNEPFMDEDGTSSHEKI